MALASMTGFARQAGQSGAWTWAWEVKTVNAKGFDLRLRLPPGFDSLEPAVRADVPKQLARGTCFASLAAQRAGAGTDIRINRLALDALVAALEVKAAHPEAAITYVRKQNARGDRRHPHPDQVGKPAAGELG